MHSTKGNIITWTQKPVYGDLPIGKLERSRKEVAKAYRKNRITLREAAKLLSADYREIQDILTEEGIPISNLTEGEAESRIKKKLKRHALKEKKKHANSNTRG